MYEFARDGLVNLVGGCCGTTPDHIHEVANRMVGITPRPRRQTGLSSDHLLLAGLEPLRYTLDMDNISSLIYCERRETA